MGISLSIFHARLQKKLIVYLTSLYIDRYKFYTLNGDYYHTARLTYIHLIGCRR